MFVTNSLLSEVGFRACPDELFASYCGYRQLTAKLLNYWRLSAIKNIEIELHL